MAVKEREAPAPGPLGVAGLVDHDELGAVPQAHPAHDRADGGTSPQGALQHPDDLPLRTDDGGGQAHHELVGRSVLLGGRGDVRPRECTTATKELLVARSRPMIAGSAGQRPSKRPAALMTSKLAKSGYRRCKVAASSENSGRFPVRKTWGEPRLVGQVGHQL